MRFLYSFSDVLGDMNGRWLATIGWSGHKSHDLSAHGQSEYRNPSRAGDHNFASDQRRFLVQRSDCLHIGIDNTSPILCSPVGSSDGTESCVATTTQLTQNKVKGSFARLVDA